MSQLRMPAASTLMAAAAVILSLVSLFYGTLKPLDLAFVPAERVTIVHYANSTDDLAFLMNCTFINKGGTQSASVIYDVRAELLNVDRGGTIATLKWTSFQTTIYSDSTPVAHYVGEPAAPIFIPGSSAISKGILLSSVGSVYHNLIAGNYEMAITGKSALTNKVVFNAKRRFRLTGDDLNEIGQSGSSMIEITQ